MTDTLYQAYLPLLIWTGLGFVLCHFVPDAVPRLLGRSLYWIGIPLEIFTLARQTDFAASAKLTPFVMVGALVVGVGLAGSSLKLVQWRSLHRPEGASPALPTNWQLRSRQGSFILSSILGNTGFVGLAIAPTFIDPAYQGWIVFYSVAHNLIGTYGIGVAIASYFGRDEQQNHWWVQLRDVLTVPSLWAFGLGTLTRSVPFPDLVEAGLQRSIWAVIPGALVLMGVRLSQLQGLKSLQLAIVPAVLKVLVIPLLVGIATTLLHFAPPARLAMVLMSGMPTAFAGLILAEEYELDRELIASSILLTTFVLLMVIPVWLLIFG
jgi:predicted permease